MGNSEVGHLNIGAGRVVLMDITRIDQAFSSGALFQNELLLGAMKRGRERQLHLMGLLSDGGVHSHIEHLFALLRMAQQNKVERVFVHCFLDGRDTPPHSGIDYLRQLQQKMRELGVGRIASLVGRYYAMDRDNRWERVERAYRAVVHGEAERRSADPIDGGARRATNRASPTNSSSPMVITTGSEAGAPPVARIRDDDAVIFFNFRADRARQMTRAIAEPGFDKFADRGAAEKSFLRGHDAIRQDLFLAAISFWAGKTRAHPGAGVRGDELSQSARGGNGEVRARDLFFQRRRGEAVCRRRAHPGAFAESGDLRSEAGNVRGGHHRQRDSGHRKGRVRRRDHEFRQRRHGGPFGKTGSDDSRRGRPWTRASGASFRRCGRAAAPGSSPPTTATRKR